MTNLIIADSLVARNIAKSWVAYSTRIKNLEIDAKYSRNSGYVRDLKLSGKYNTIIIQVGIVDSAPRVVKYIPLRQIDKQRGISFTTQLCDRKFVIIL